MKNNPDTETLVEFEQSSKGSNVANLEVCFKINHSKKTKSEVKEARGRCKHCSMELELKGANVKAIQHSTDVHSLCSTHIHMQ